MSRTKVFVSYSRQDQDWLDRLLEALAVLERLGLVEVWSDKQIEVGQKWEQEIESALRRARVAVLLMSPSFLASDFVWKREMPLILAHHRAGMRILPLLVRPSAWRLEPELAGLQARPGGDRALSQGLESQIDQSLAEFAYELAALVGRSPAAVDLELPRLADEKALRSASDLIGRWCGHYNQTRPIELQVQEVTGRSFRGRIRYLNEEAATLVEGAVEQSWSPADPNWAQLGLADHSGKALAVGFREVGYETKGVSPLSFDGEYRVLVRGDELKGAWFSGSRLVGLISLQRAPDSAGSQVRTKG